MVFTVSIIQYHIAQSYRVIISYDYQLLVLKSHPLHFSPAVEFMH